jgi:hypothetical protein
VRGGGGPAAAARACVSRGLRYGRETGEALPGRERSVVGQPGKKGNGPGPANSASFDFNQIFKLNKI